MNKIRIAFMDLTLSDCADLDGYVEVRGDKISMLGGDCFLIFRFFCSFVRSFVSFCFFFVIFLSQPISDSEWFPYDRQPTILAKVFRDRLRGDPCGNVQRCYSPYIAVLCFAMLVVLCCAVDVI